MDEQQASRIRVDNMVRIGAAMSQRFNDNMSLAYTIDWLTTRPTMVKKSRLLILDGSLIDPIVRYVSDFDLALVGLSNVQLPRSIQPFTLY